MSETPDETPQRWIAGHAVRTTNEMEADPARAQLPALWQRVMADAALRDLVTRTGDEYYAVLLDYEHDEHGLYTQVVGVEVDDPDMVPATFIMTRRPSTTTRSYPFDGPMPQALLDAWQRVWDDTASGAIRRLYGVDIEVHRGPGSGEILVSVRT
jgi:predicted transcriptional regulator YdeE